MKSSLFKDAPPTNTPSTFGIDIISAAFEPLTDAPYRTGVPANPISANVLAISVCAPAISSAVGVNPAPIAHRGSYAIIIGVPTSDGIDSRTPDSITAIVLPACFSSIVSPTQIIGIIPLAKTWAAFCRTV